MRLPGLSVFAFSAGQRTAARLALAGTAAFLATSCAKSRATPADAGPKPVAVSVAPIVYSSAAVPIRASGVLARKSEADLSFKVGGVIEAVFVRAGDVVAPGQELARLRLDEIEAQLTQARSAAEKTRRDLERAQRLETQGAMAREEMQDARTRFDQATAQLRIAEFNRSYAVITAPAAGRVLRRLAEPNELVASGRAILAFGAEEDGWLVRAGLAERDLLRVHVGDAVNVFLAGADKATAVGRVARISEAADALTRTTQIEIELAAVPAGVRSGFVVALEIAPQAVAPRPIVPVTALVEGSAGSASVFVVGEGESAARRVAVEVESLAGADAFLRTTLPRSARVVVGGAEFLREGALVAARP